MVQSRKRFSQRTLTFPGHAHEAYDSGYTVDGLRFATGCFHFILYYYDMERVMGNDTELLKMIVGLIIGPVDQSLQTYRRIGMFSRQTGSAWYPTEYPEFENWDPSNYERHTITII